MKRAIKRIVKCLIIYVVIFTTLLSNVSYCGYTQEQVGDAIAGFATHVATDYKDTVRYEQWGDHGHPGHNRLQNPIWSPESYSWGDTVYFDCTSFASGCYHAVTGLFSEAQCTGSLGGFTSGDWEQATISSLSDLKIGDLVYVDDSSAHGIIYVGDTPGAEGTAAEVGGAAGDGVGFRDIASYIGNNSRGFKYLRVSKEGAEKLTSLDTSFASGKVGGSTANVGSGIDYSNFYFNGIPDGKYSIASKKSIFEMMVDSLSSLVDFFAGLITYLFRGVIISFISVFDRLINNTVASMNGDKKSLKEAGISANDADDPSKINRSVTIEGLVFGDEDMDLFDVNIFRVD